MPQRFDTYSNGPLYQRCAKWANAQPDLPGHANNHSTRLVAVSYCKRVFNKIKNLPEGQPIGTVLPTRFTAKEITGGLVDERHLESLTLVALEYYEMLCAVEEVASGFVQAENTVLPVFEEGYIR